MSRWVTLRACIRPDQPEPQSDIFLRVRVQVSESESQPSRNSDYCSYSSVSYRVGYQGLALQEVHSTCRLQHLLTPSSLCQLFEALQESSHHNLVRWSIGLMIIKSSVSTRNEPAASGIVARHTMRKSGSRSDERGLGITNTGSMFLVRASVSASSYGAQMLDDAYSMSRSRNCSSAAGE